MDTFEAGEYDQTLEEFPVTDQNNHKDGGVPSRTRVVTDVGLPELVQTTQFISNYSSKP